jgi:hypothetical protein
VLICIPYHGGGVLGLLFNSLSVCFLHRMWKLAHTVIPMLSFSRQLSKYVLILSRSADRVVSMGGTLCLLS